jgi:PAS domain S-box-containing protein
MLDRLEQESVESCLFVDAGLNEHRRDAGELYLRATLDACASAAALLNEAGTILYVNGGWRQLAAQRGLAYDLYGVGLKYIDICEQVSGASVQEAVPIVEGVRRILLSRATEFQKEIVYRRSTGSQYVLIHAARVDVPSAFRVLVTHEDTALSKWTSEAERRTEERLRLLLEITNILPWEADVESGRFTYVGEQAVSMLGYPLEQWYEPDFWSSHLHPDDRKRAFEDCLKYSQTLDNYQFEYRMIARDGRIAWFHDIVSVIRKNGVPATIRGFLIDITERKRTEEALINLSGRLINAQEDERKRIARELHDDLNQRMALLSIELAQLEQQTHKPRNLGPIVESLQTKAREISAEIHRISYRLHPSKLDHLGLAAAVESLCEELSQGHKLKIKFHQKGSPEALPKDVRLCVFRVAQESLHNCIKHSGARDARVVLERTERAIRLSVSDNGCGFETESGALKKGLGFTSMRERLRLVGGELQISSQPLKGTRVEISVPLTRG